MKVLFTGGGTGGHIFPLIAVARALRTQKTDSLRIEFAGPLRVVRGALRENNIPTHSIITGKFRRYPSLYYLVDIPKIAVGLVQALFHLIRYRPDIVFSKGGYGSFPTVVVAWFLRVPIVAHESDSVAGLANRVLAMFANTIITSFSGIYPNLPGNKLILLGNPVRDMRGGSAERARETFNITSEKPLLLIIGGSQGAMHVNDLVLDALQALVRECEIIHLVGANNLKSVEIRAQQRLQDRAAYHPREFLNEAEMRDAYAACTLVVSRAGSSSLFEIALVGKPSILIPLPTSASGHQLKNAIIYQEAGAGTILDGRTTTPEMFTHALKEMLADPSRQHAMRRAALAFAKPHAAQQIAKLILLHARHH